jgi:hypothetical protein
MRQGPIILGSLSSLLDLVAASFRTCGGGALCCGWTVTRPEGAPWCTAIGSARRCRGAAIVGCVYTLYKRRRVVGQQAQCWPGLRCEKINKAFSSKLIAQVTLTRVVDTLRPSETAGNMRGSFRRAAVSVRPMQNPSRPEMRMAASRRPASSLAPSCLASATWTSSLGLRPPRPWTARPSATNSGGTHHSASKPSYTASSAAY